MINEQKGQTNAQSNNRPIRQKSINYGSYKPGPKCKMSSKESLSKMGAIFVYHV